MQFYEALFSMVAQLIFAAAFGFAIGCILYEIKQRI